MLYLCFLMREGYFGHLVVRSYTPWGEHLIVTCVPRTFYLIFFFLTALFHEKYVGITFGLIRIQIC